ncbi:alpha/beta hydrolase family protein [Aurantibacter sp.]|uniref:alpha/beta hydrolase family protein n=1 Tax=Aurantibacter sp. TaxID=2807103 RepID=UPI003263D345
MRNFKLYFSSIVFIVMVSIRGIYAQENISVIKNWITYKDAPNAQYFHIAEQAYKQLEKREENIASLNTLSEWKARQTIVKKTLLDIVGPFPKKTALNAKIIRKVDKTDYSVEHVIFESQPKFYVSSSLFLPKGIKKGTKAPAIIYTSGHTKDGYHAAYQQIILNLVKKGFIVFAFDPVGQGERQEYFDQPESKSYVTTKSHSYSGAQAFITGSSQASYMIWDGIRAVDYLLSRKEVDSERIGITGRSGGGTQASQIAAFDERILAVAPENYITNYTRLFQSIGPQDGEQNLFSGIARGLDHADLLAVRAPKPALILATTGDFFSVQGFQETADEVSNIYNAYGKSDSFNFTVDVFPAHKSTKNNREAMYAFFQKYLNNPGSSEDLEVEFLSPEEMQVTDTGQVSTSFTGETIFSLNKKNVDRLIDTLNQERNNLKDHLSSVLNVAKKLSGYVEPTEIDKPVLTGRINRVGYTIDMKFVKGEGDYVIPYLLFKPDVSNGKSLVYLNPSGKSAEADEGREIEWFVKNGFTVLAPDLLGVGEVGPVNFRMDSELEGINYNVWFGSVLIGRSIVGIQAGDVNRLIKLLEFNDPTTKIYGVAKGTLCPTLLHASAFNLSIERIALIQPYSSYATIASTRMYAPKYVNSLVPGALTAYDLPDLRATLVPRKLLMIGETNGAGGQILNKKLSREITFIKKVYNMNIAKEQFVIKPLLPNAKYDELYAEWIN